MDSQSRHQMGVSILDDQTPEERLAESLAWAYESRHERGGNPVPREAFSGFVSLGPKVVDELILINSPNQSGLGGRLLLQRRKDGIWKGEWHTIGGFRLPGETLEHALNRHALSIGAQIEYIPFGLTGAIFHREDFTHPYGLGGNTGHLSQSGYLCRILNPDQIVLSKDLQWFLETPSPMLRGHEIHTEAYFSLGGRLRALREEWANI